MSTPDAHTISDELKLIADDLEQSSVIIPFCRLFTYVRQIDNARYIIKCSYRADFIRIRADKLLKQYSKRVKTRQQCIGFRPSRKQAKYSNRVENQFLQDNECDDLDEYRKI